MPTKSAEYDGSGGHDGGDEAADPAASADSPPVSPDGGTGPDPDWGTVGGRTDLCYLNIKIN